MIRFKSIKKFLINKDNLEIYSQFSRFLISGIIANIFNFISFITLFNLIRLNIFFSSLIGQLIAISISYFLNSRFSFKKRLKIKYKLIFFIYYIFSILIASLLVSFLNNIGLNYIISWFLIISIISFVNFLVNKFIVFR